jgi:hypothetical protein
MAINIEGDLDGVVTKLIPHFSPTFPILDMQTGEDFPADEGFM